MILTSGPQIEKYLLPIRALVSLIILYVVLQWGSGAIRILAGTFFSYMSFAFIIDLVQKAIHAPKTVIIEGDKFEVKMIYGKTAHHEINDLESITDMPLLQLITDHTIVVRIASSKETFYFSRGLSNLREFLMLVKDQNPTCKIEGRLLVDLFDTNR